MGGEISEDNGTNRPQGESAKASVLAGNRVGWEEGRSLGFKHESQEKGRSPRLVTGSHPSGLGSENLLAKHTKTTSGVQR